MITSERNALITRLLILVVNLAAILFMTIIISQTTRIICFNDGARDFLEKGRSVPIVPWKVWACSLSLYFLLVLTIALREKRKIDGKAALFALSLLDLVLCILIVFFLNLGHKGILLIAIANALVYLEGRTGKYAFIVMVTAVYILLDYDVLSIQFKMTSINDYMEYYKSTEKLYLYSARNFLTSINDVLFIVFMVINIQGRIDENAKIRELNTALVNKAEELSVLNVQIEEYSRRSEEMAKIKERNRLAREIHDTVGHSLTGISLGLEACLDIIDSDPGRTKSQLRKITSLARNGLDDIQLSISQLRPDVMERYSLIAALEKIASNISELSGVTVNFHVSGDMYKLSTEVEETVYRIVQESVTNSVRHGNAKRIDVALNYAEFSIVISVVDDGAGCEKIAEGFGLRHIRERVRFLCGEAAFSRGESGGFRVKAEIPVKMGEKKV
jgi:signal transduction histidine kinase